MNLNLKNLQALGTGIVDIDTKELIEIASGELVEANILSVVKGTARKSSAKYKAQLKELKQLGIYIKIPHMEFMDF